MEVRIHRVRLRLGLGFRLFIVGVFIQFQYEVAVFNIDVVVCEGRAYFLICFIITFNPFFLVKGVKIVAEIQREII